MSLKNKVAIVTGGSSGIGAAIAVKFTAEGAKVAIVGRNEKKLAAVSEECQKNGSQPLVIVADVTKEDDANRIINDTIEHFGKLDILVNNAGILNKCTIFDKNIMEMFDKVMATNLRSIVHLTLLAAPYIIETKGNIINMSSIAAKYVYGNMCLYKTSKAGLDHFTRCVALELAPKGVRVNTINPGPVKSDILENMGVLDPSAQAAMFENAKNRTALKRVADAEEVADLAVFVASDKGRSITGTALFTDNGSLLFPTQQ